jgi:nitrogen fixation-related uncharacterized protein
MNAPSYLAALLGVAVAFGVALAAFAWAMKRRKSQRPADRKNQADPPPDPYELWRENER